MNLERIATLLANGLKPANVATIVGCTPAYLSQLAKSNEEFKNLLADKTALADKETNEELSLSVKYQAAEHTLIDRIMELSTVAEMRDLTSALRVISERQEKTKTRLNPVIEGQTVTNNIIQISVPSHALPELCMTREQQVLSVDNINLAPLTSTGVINLFKGMNEKKMENGNEQRRILSITEKTSQENAREEYKEVETLEDLELLLQKA